MSLKAFHILFVTASVALCLFLSGYYLHAYLKVEANPIYLGWVAGGVAGTAGLLWYGQYFLKKLKNISLL